LTWFSFWRPTADGARGVLRDVAAGDARTTWNEQRRRHSKNAAHVQMCERSKHPPTLTSHNEVEGRARVAVISYGLWQRQAGFDEEHDNKRSLRNEISRAVQR